MKVVYYAIKYNINIIYFHFWSIIYIYKHLNDIFLNPNLFSNINENIIIKIPNDIILKYNSKLKRLGDDIRKDTVADHTFLFNIISFSIIRILCIIVAALKYDVSVIICCILLQFILLPYSFAASVLQFVLLCPSMFLPHYVFNIIWQYFNLPTYSFYIGYQFIMIFFVIDFILCFKCVKSKKSVWFGWKREFVHFLWGAINTKSYQLLLFVLLKDRNINLYIIFFDVCFGITHIISNVIVKICGSWSTHFYVAHRLAHLPRVYEQAHKFHHYLHDASPFDAHIYGSGAPEDTVSILFEFILSFYFNLIPASLSFYLLQTSWTNKVGHTRKCDGNKDGSNHHCDHHLIHRKNFGIFNACLDMIFLTNHPNNNIYRSNHLTIERKLSEDTKEIHMHLTPNTVPKYNPTFQDPGVSILTYIQHLFSS